MTNTPPSPCARCEVVPTYGVFLSCCWRDAEHFPSEHRALRYSATAAALTGALLWLAYWSLLVDLPGFSGRVAAYLPYLVIGTAAVCGAVWHLRAVRRQLSEATGMMVGMTFGMIAGFLAGYFLGATNGMFMGSVVGVVAGMATGWYVGDCCVMMGRMEGLMAGLMSGIMGAMTAVMLLSDRIAWFTPILLVACLVILSGLSYLIHREHRERTGVAVTYAGSGLLPFTAFCFLAVAALVAVMAFGPRSFLFASL